MIVWVLISLVALQAQDCQPRYVRIFFNPSPDPELKVDMKVLFNTLAACPDAFISSSYLNSHEQHKCYSKPLEKATFLQQWVHECNLQIDSPSPIDNFSYVVHTGQKNSQQDSPSYLVELSTETQPFIAVIAANLDFLNDRLYLPFTQAFQSLLVRRTAEIDAKDGENHYRINAIILNGGFAQNLGDRKGRNYNKIMTLLSQFSARWPLIVNLGPDQMDSEDYALVEQSFVLGGLAQGQERTAVQTYQFGGKANIALIETGGQYFSLPNKTSPEFNRTLSSLEKFISESRDQGNQFTMVFNHYAVSCSSSADHSSSYNCDVGAKNLAPLQTVLSTNEEGPGIDLYVGAYQNNYERNYPFREGRFMRQEDSRYSRGDFVTINEGTGGEGLEQQPRAAQDRNQVIEQFGKPGFGLITIKGNAELKKKNATTILQDQQIVRKIERKQTQVSAHGKEEVLSAPLLDLAYLRNQDLTQLELFLLNYKHLTIQKGQLLVEDVFRIVTQPATPLLPQRHHLRSN